MKNKKFLQNLLFTDDDDDRQNFAKHRQDFAKHRQNNTFRSRIVWRMPKRAEQ
jgi:hypothetical protein